MFSKNKKAQQASSAQPRSVPSIISADLKIVGDLSSTGEIQIDGEVTGDIRSKVLLVGETASVRGEIRAETVRVHGHVNGQIKATYVNLAKSAHVVGDILHENLSIQEGAFLEGHITHMSEQQVRESVVHPVDASKPAEDRVNLVVKGGSATQQKPPQPHNPNAQNTGAVKVEATVADGGDKSKPADPPAKAATVG
jgi:cytoskeletal protein CcmA (bactofilin family)